MEGWLLKAAGWLGIGGMDLVADAPRWKRSRWLPVVLVAERNADGSGRGLSLTARSGRLLGDYDGPEAFMARPLHVGGPERTPLRMIHPYSQVRGSRPLAGEGLCKGGDLESAMEWVTNGQGSSLRFRFFVGEVSWGPGELVEELQRGQWLPLRCSEDLVLDESEDIGGQPLWTELALLAGGEAAEVAETWDLVD